MKTNAAAAVLTPPLITMMSPGEVSGLTPWAIIATSLPATSAVIAAPTRRSNA